jgi:cyclophilin family peptidyl-prolyl cis-trans isomerase
VLERLKADYPNELRIVYRHFPLIQIHDKAQITAEATEAAGAQGRFWEMHDLLFERQDEWKALSESEVLETLVGYAGEVGLADIEQFRADLENDTYAAKVMADYEAATAANLGGTPTLFMNQAEYPIQALGLAYEGMEIFVQIMKQRGKWYAQPEQVIELAKSYQATIETEKGEILIDLFSDTAPANVNSFAFLAGEGWYRDVTFHRVLADFMAQGGDPTGIGIGDPGYRCGDEVTPERTFTGPGVVAMANSGPNTNGSQFFITFTATPHLNEGFTIIGQVREGQEVVRSITLRDPNDPAAPPGDKIIDITVTEK